MEEQVLNNNIKWVKIGLVWNFITLLIAMFTKAYSSWASGSSFGEAMVIFIFILFIGGVVLGANLYIFKCTIKDVTLGNIKLGIVLSVLAMFSLNIIGSIITLVGYLKLRNNYLNSANIK